MAALGGWMARPLSLPPSLWVGRSFCLLLRGELMPYLGGDGFGVHFVGAGGFLEYRRGIATRGSKQDARVHHDCPSCSFAEPTLMNLRNGLCRW